jgi:hypothetical protein
MNEKYGLVSYSLIKLLLAGCTTCGSSRSVQSIENHGFCLVATLYCTDGHKNKWYSSTRYNNKLVINELIPMSIVLSGGVIKDFVQFFNSANIASLAETTYYNKINCGIRPAINKYFLNKHTPNLIAKLNGDCSIIADGRFSSPGHSATKCTVSFLDEKTSKVIKVVNTDVRSHNGISQRMEPSATMEGLDELLNKDNISIKEFITDGNLSIRRLMKENHPSICHQNDLWHKGRSLQKLLKKAKIKNIHLPDIWITRIRCYMYKCFKECKGDLITSKAIWDRFTKRRCSKYNEHRYRNHYPDCSKFFKSNIGLADELYNVMKAVEKDFSYYINYKNTCKIESFHNVILKYAPKRIPYRTNYGMRIQLAALDWNHMQDTKVIHSTQKWNKFTKRFTISLRKLKNFSYHKDIIRDFINSRYVTTPPKTNPNQQYLPLPNFQLSQKQT